MVKLHFETLAPGMNAKLDAKYRASNGHRTVKNDKSVFTKFRRHGSVNCLLADAVRMPFNRTQL